MSNLYPPSIIQHAHLQVADLKRALAFYVDLVGFSIVEQRGATAVLSATGGAPHLALTERAGARPRPRHSTGLYHIAVLLPDRRALARLLKRLLAHSWPLQGASDHGVSEALYLADPDGNGLEFYVDRPREAWYDAQGNMVMITAPLDLDDLLAQASTDPATWNGLAPGTRIGHLHLHVADLEQATAFYRDIIGLDVMIRSDRYRVAFLAAEGYHHHIGLNTWAGEGAPPPPEDAAGLRSFTLCLPDWQGALARARAAGLPGESLRHDDDPARAVLFDPDGNQVMLVVENQRADSRT